MKPMSSQTIGGFARQILAAVALTAAVTFPAGAMASTAKNAKIINTVTASYKDAGTGAATYTITQTQTVTVALVQSALSVGTYTDQTTNAGVAANYSYYTLTSTANGNDAYNVTLTFSNASANLATELLGYTLYKYDTGTGGLVVAQSLDNASAINSATGNTTLSSVSLNATTVTGWNSGTSTLSIPGGTLNGIAADTVVMVDGHGPYLVTAVTVGGDPVPGGSKNEGSITLATYGSGGDALAVLTGDANLIGSIVGERLFLKVNVTGTLTSGGQFTTNATITHAITSVTTTNSVTGGQTSNITTIRGTQLAVVKTVQDCGQNGASCVAVPLGGPKPGDTLEYTVTVQNTGTGQANTVSLADYVPAFTTLLKDGTDTAVTATDAFANITYNGTTVNPTVGGSGTLNVAYGKVTYTTSPSTAGSALNFYLGTSSDASTGGNIAAGTPVFTIKYRVKIN